MRGMKASKPSPRTRRRTGGVVTWLALYRPHVAKAPFPHPSTHGDWPQRVEVCCLQLQICTWTHTSERSLAKGKVPVSDKAKKVKDSYDKNVAECQQSGIQKNLNQNFFETVAGQKKGKVPGLGMGADLYYERSSRRKGTSSTTCTPSIVSQLSQRLEDSDRARAEFERQSLEMERRRLEMERERMEWLKAREEERQREREYVEEMKRTLESYSQMFSQCSGSFPFTQPRDPRDPPDPSGASGACAT